MSFFRIPYILPINFKFSSNNFVSAFTRPFPFNVIFYNSLSASFKLRQDEISYYPANLSRCVPGDFGPTAEKHIYHLLFLISFPCLRGKPCNGTDDIISSFHIHFGEFLDSHVPYYNVLSTKDFSINTRESLHHFQKYSYIPKILQVRNSIIDDQLNPTLNEPLVELIQYYDSFPHLFLNTSQGNNFTYNYHKQPYHDMYSSTYAKIYIRELNGTLISCDDSSQVFQVINYDVNCCFRKHFIIFPSPICYVLNQFD